MTLHDLITDLDARGVRLSARLTVDAPAGVVTPELRDALTTHKPLLLQHVVREIVWAELSAWRWGPAADDPTPGIVIEQPNRARTLATLEAVAPEKDPYAVAEREAIQFEGNLCGLNTHLMDNEGDGGGVVGTHARPLGPTLS
jgi:hypothetical protein